MKVAQTAFALAALVGLASAAAAPQATPAVSMVVVGS